MDKTIDCVVCGSCVADVLVRPLRFDAPVGRGNTLVVEPIELATGGIVGNAGIAMRRLGMRVAALGYVGDDHWGRFLRERLAAEAIDVRCLKNHARAATTTAVALIDPDGERSFAYDPGATDQLDRTLLLDGLDLFARSRMALIGYYSLLPRLESDLPEILGAIRERGCGTALDSAGSGGSMRPLDAILPHLDVYVPSLGEARHQTGRRDPRAIVEVYRDHGAEGLLGVKLGSRGAMLSPASGEYAAIDPVPPPGAVVDTTGAGDCFYAGLLTGLLRDLPLAEAGRLAAACGALSTTAKGATTALGSYDEIARLAGVA